MERKSRVDEQKRIPWDAKSIVRDTKSIVQKTKYRESEVQSAVITALRLRPQVSSRFLIP
ncbi:MAG: hypothetical protein FWD31_11765 [Planctomycetaceae bacterium]|nr:hypothetical protein [Planctomycetaceae bacterium]